jgi:cell wall-associated NlpC family hydrolase
MGIYIGGGQYVHAPQTGDVVKISSMSDRSDYVGAVRP